ncbi:MAG: substrate-binding domain-containing protein [Treponema sp.]|uniref:substrate-binding domain-containing protein n=1 Tax=Treponema sp. TaxID=166 RepID=UPI001E198DC2|nr:substrate-binding domain-containing protein [Treponema sp.]MBS7311236.1 substrate-binding domain-containing protein [Treponema sp.]MCI5696632.1 substrate-binding domain-containing protein [Spirochaetia bacterium]
MKLSLKKITALALTVMASASVFAAPKFNSKKTISVMSREEGSGTRGAFIELFGVEQKNSSGKKVDYTTEEAAITNSTSVMLTSVAGDIYSIGYVSLGSLNDSVKALKIEGVDATVSNIKNKSYKISRPFNIAVKEKLSAPAQDFVNFIMSSEGQKIVEKNKYIAVESKSFTSNKASGKVVVAGSSSVSPVMEKLIEAYKSVNPNARIELQTSDSTTGVTNAANGTCDIGMASRGLKETEKAKGLKEITIAIDGIAVVVNKANPLVNAKIEIVRDIYMGKIQKWSEIK